MKKLRVLLLLQFAIVIYSLANVAAKMASGYSFLSWQFVLIYALELLALGIYAILWQQIIKRIDLSIAYISRAFSVFWLMLWAVFIFQEKISVNNIIGVVLILAGVLAVNIDELE